MMNSRYWRWLRPRYILRELLSLDDKPHAIALGAAIGMWVGLTPTVGIQIPMVIAAWLISRRWAYFNVTAALLVVMISNPLTTPIIYWATYKLGAMILGSGLEVSFGKVMEFDSFQTWWTTVCDIVVQAGWPLAVGSLIIATTIAIPTYAAVFYLCKRFHLRTAAPGHQVLPLKSSPPENESTHRLDDADSKVCSSEAKTKTFDKAV